MNSEREFFVFAFARELSGATLDDARTLLRLATKEQRWNEIQCSVDIDDVARAKGEADSLRRRRLVAQVCSRIGASAHWNGDPRGFPFVLGLPSGRTYDWGGRGLGVPGEGLGAAELERMVRR